MDSLLYKVFRMSISGYLKVCSRWYNKYQYCMSCGVSSPIMIFLACLAMAMSHTAHTLSSISTTSSSTSAQLSAKFGEEVTTTTGFAFAELGEDIGEVGAPASAASAAAKFGEEVTASATKLSAFAFTKLRDNVGEVGASASAAGTAAKFGEEVTTTAGFTFAELGEDIGEVALCCYESCGRKDHQAEELHGACVMNRLCLVFEGGSTCEVYGSCTAFSERVFGCACVILGMSLRTWRRASEVRFVVLLFFRGQ